jgi:hypothetical protein
VHIFHLFSRDPQKSGSGVRANKFVVIVKANQAHSLQPVGFASGKEYGFSGIITR